MARRVLPVRVQHGAIEIGHHIMTWRKLQNLTAEQVAERANVSRTTLRRLEQGDAGVGLDVFLSVVRALGQLERVVEVLDPYETDLGRARAEDTLPERVRR